MGNGFEKKIAMISDIYSNFEATLIKNNVAKVAIDLLRHTSDELIMIFRPDDSEKLGAWENRAKSRRFFKLSKELFEIK